MTLPYEEESSIIRARQFLEDLLDSHKIPRIPKEVRREALHLLRHYPNEYRTKDIYKNEKLWMKKGGSSRGDLDIMYGK